MLRNKDTEALQESLKAKRIDGKTFCKSYSDLIDAHLIKIAGNLPDDCALIATGGYGRAELCPYSDIDLLFLTPEKKNEIRNKAIEDILYPLWDSGLKVGHAIRNIGQCYDLAREDLSTLTSLLDMRLICGNSKRFNKLQKKMQNHIKRTKKNFMRSKLKERDRRHSKQGDTRFVLEPNIKEGKGALRDFQTMLWVSHAVHGASTLLVMKEKEIITRAEALNFQKAHDFLLTVRCHLHDIAGRAEERLHFDIQTQLAKRLGYAERDHAKAVERFMKHYFLITRDIGDMTRVLCATFHTRKRRLPVVLNKLNDFAIVSGLIDFTPEHSLKDNPALFIEIFRTMQETGHDIHPRALRIIAQKIKLIDDNLRNDKKTNLLFLDILCDPKNTALILRRMNERGVLERFIPAFKPIKCLMQFDRYHAYTVDEHTLRAIDILHKILNGNTEQSAAFTRSISTDIKYKRAILVAMMFHDIGKGRKTDHSELGARIVKKYAPRFALSAKETEVATWLVAQHLLLSRTALTRDLDDPKTLEDFLSVIPDAEHLQLLTLLTVADIMAVGPERWTAWKSRLIQDLYTAALSRLNNEEDLTSGLQSTIEWPDYIEYDETHIEILQKPDVHATQVTVYTRDKDGLFAALAGGLAASGTNIISADINTLEDGRVIDRFTIQTHAGKAFTKDSQHDRLRCNIKNALDGNIDILNEAKRNSARQRRKDRVFQVRKQVRFDNSASRHHTVCEVVTRDSPALLYRLACCLRDQGVSIHRARITTAGLKIKDVFYIQDQDGKKITDKTLLSAIKHNLEPIL